MRFKDRGALITAGASGIGRATADIMAREGGVVVVADNNQGRLDATVADIEKSGGRAHGKLVDALDRSQVDRLVPAVVQEFGAIDILVNAVGGSTIISRSSATVSAARSSTWHRSPGAA